MANILTSTTPPSVHSVPPHVKWNDFNDKRIQQLLNKLDEGTETIMNLRSLLTYKTVELNELVHQLELIDQVLVNVEHGTEQIEFVLKDYHAGKDKLLDAEATLDSAIKSACHLCSNSSHYTTRMTIVNNINSLLNQLNIDSFTFWNYQKDNTDNLEVLQNILSHLNLAKTIASNIKSDAKHRSTILKKNNVSTSSIEQIKKLGDKIKSQLDLYKLYTRDSPFLLNGKQDILTILDREDSIISKKQQQLVMQHHHHILPRQQQNNNNNNNNNTIATVNIATTTTTTKKKRQSTTNANNITTHTVHSTNYSKSTINKSTINKSTVTDKSMSNKRIINNDTLLLLSRHTSSSKAKSKEPKRPQPSESTTERGPGSTLRLRNMLAKRNNNSALKMLKNHQNQILSSCCTTTTTAVY